MMSKHEKEVNVAILFHTWVKPICDVMKNIFNSHEKKIDTYDEILTNMVKINPDLVDHMLVLKC